MVDVGCPNIGTGCGAGRYACGGACGAPGTASGIPACKEDGCEETPECRLAAAAGCGPPEDHDADDDDGGSDAAGRYDPVAKLGCTDVLEECCGDEPESEGC